MAPKKKTYKPDWNNEASIHGGSIKDFDAKSIVRKYPHKGMKRRVNVEITSWVGVSIGAKHWVATVEEERNPIWDAEMNGWRTTWDDLDGKGTSMRSPKFLNEKAAQEWVQWMLRAFDPKVYEFTFQYLTAEDCPQWFYAREGD